VPLPYGACPKRRYLFGILNKLLDVLRNLITLFLIEVSSAGVIVGTIALEDNPRASEAINPVIARRTVLVLLGSPRNAAAEASGSSPPTYYRPSVPRLFSLLHLLISSSMCHPLVDGGGSSVEQRQNPNQPWAHRSRVKCPSCNSLHSSI